MAKDPFTIDPWGPIYRVDGIGELELMLNNESIMTLVLNLVKIWKRFSNI